MTYPTDHIDVCICTYKRAALLDHLLGKLQNQQADGAFTYSILIVDNDALMSAEHVVQRHMSSAAVRMEYFVEAQKGYSSARNRLVQQSQGDYIAFIDDDEFPEDSWLLNLHRTCKACRADGVLGPVKPHFESEPPGWLVKSRLCEKPGYKIDTGAKLHWSNTRTSNVLIAAHVFSDKANAFRPEFGKTGGEDVDFFRRMMNAGFTFVWCEEAHVYETVPVERWQRTYHLRRALLQGAVDAGYLKGEAALKHTIFSVGKTVAAMCLYTISLPLLFVAGQHVFMKYLVKNCHHIGRLFAMCGILLVKEKTF